MKQLNNTPVMKFILIVLFAIIGISASAQRNYSTTQINSIHTGLNGSEGDLYMDTVLNELYIGMLDGQLYKVTSTDDQQVQTYSYNPVTNVVTIELENGGGTLTVDLSELEQDLDLTGNTLSLTGDASTVDLSPYLDNTDGQNLSDGGKSGNDQTVNISGGTGITFSVADADSSTSNEIQTIDVSSHTSAGINLSLLNDGEATKVIPVLSTNGSNDLAYNGDGIFLDVSALDSSMYKHNGSLTSSRTVTMNGNNLTFDGTQDVVIQSDGEVGIGTTSPGARLDVDHGSVKFSDYGIGTYLDTLAAVDSAIFHLAVTTSGDIVETNTVKSSKIFYPPAIVIDVSAVVSGQSIDLYQEYLDRFGAPLLASPSAPSTIPTYQRNELYYYVTDLDTAVFDNYSVDDNGNFNYDVISVPTNNCTFINVVFVIK